MTTTEPPDSGPTASTLVVYAARIVLAAVIALLVLVAAPALVGWHSGVILNGSMSPALRPGDVVVTGPAGTVYPGQLVGVDDPRRPGQVIVHRVVKVTARGTVTTRGDANPLADSTPVPPGSVRGVVRFSVPAIGLVVLWWHEGNVMALMAVAGVLLVLIWLATAPSMQRRPPQESPPVVSAANP